MFLRDGKPFPGALRCAGWPVRRSGGYDLRVSRSCERTTGFRSECSDDSMSHKWWRASSPFLEVGFGVIHANSLSPQAEQVRAAATYPARMREIARAANCNFGL